MPGRWGGAKLIVDEVKEDDRLVQQEVHNPAEVVLQDGEVRGLLALDAGPMGRCQADRR